jgi:hypothetical protein
VFIQDQHVFVYENPIIGSRYIEFLACLFDIFYCDYVDYHGGLQGHGDHDHDQEQAILNSY